MNKYYVKREVLNLNFTNLTNRVIKVNVFVEFIKRNKTILCCMKWNRILWYILNNSSCIDYPLIVMVNKTKFCRICFDKSIGVKIHLCLDQCILMQLNITTKQYSLHSVALYIDIKIYIYIYIYQIYDWFKFYKG